MQRRQWICLVALMASLVGARAAPFTPASDDAPLERLPLSLRDPALRELRNSQAALKADPSNLPLALRVARSYLDFSRSSGDPRYIGYAQAALAPWWTLETPPGDVLLLRAAARQRAHLFDAALHDLDQLLLEEPRNAQARFMRATILQVTGDMAAARRECHALGGARRSLAQIACAATVSAASGDAPGAYAALKNALDVAAPTEAPLRSWSMTSLAEIAWRMNRVPDAERHFRDALALAPDDAYLLGAYADFLLDTARREDVETLLAGRDRVDPLLLRLALASKLSHSASLSERAAQLRERFDASRMRGDAVHLREEARFTLHLLGDAPRALQLAKDNWRVQKEPADLRILIEAAIAAGHRDALDLAREWVRTSGLQDATIEKLLSATTHPD